MPAWIFYARWGATLCKKPLRQLRRDLVSIQFGSFNLRNKNAEVELNHKVYALWLLLAYGMERPAIRVHHQLRKEAHALHVRDEDHRLIIRAKGILKACKNREIDQFFRAMEEIRKLRIDNGWPINSRPWRDSWRPF
jgi:hypothetical protein